MLGARAVFATHLHELATNLETLNTKLPGHGKIVSMVAGIGENPGADDAEASFTPRTFKINPGPPQGISYARDIAARFGISREQLLQLMRERAVLDSEVDINLGESF